MTDIPICPCINLFWKAVRPCKKERWSSFSQCADRVLPAPAWQGTVWACLAPCSSPPALAEAWERLFCCFIVHSSNKIQLVYIYFFFLPCFLTVFKSVLDSILFLLGVCLQSHCSSQTHFQGRFYSYGSRHPPWNALIQTLSTDSPPAFGSILSQFSAAHCSEGSQQALFPVVAADLIES